MGEPETNSTGGDGDKGKNATPDPATVPGTPEYRARMQQVADQAAKGGAGEIPQRPAHVPEKFWDAATGKIRTDEMAKSYGELEKKLTEVTGPEKKDGAGLAISLDAKGDKGLDDNATVDQVIEAAGLKRQDIGQQFAEHRKLTDEQYAALKKVNLPKALVDDYLAKDATLAKYVVDQIRQEGVTKAGGEQQLATLLEWGKTNLSAQDLQWYNQQISDPATASKGIEWLITKHKEAVGAGKAKPLVEGEGGTPEATGGFETAAEMHHAISDPRYAPTLPGGRPNPRHDPAYYRQIRARMAKTSAVSGMQLTGVR